MRRRGEKRNRPTGRKGRGEGGGEPVLGARKGNERKNLIRSCLSLSLPRLPLPPFFFVRGIEFRAASHLLSLLFPGITPARPNCFHYSSRSEAFPPGAGREAVSQCGRPKTCWERREGRTNTPRQSRQSCARRRSCCRRRRPCLTAERRRPPFCPTLPCLALLPLFSAAQHTRARPTGATGKKTNENWEGIARGRGRFAGTGRQTEAPPAFLDASSTPERDATAFDVPTTLSDDSNGGLCRDCVCNTHAYGGGEGGRTEVCFSCPASTTAEEEMAV